MTEDLDWLKYTVYDEETGELIGLKPDAPLVAKQQYEKWLTLRASGKLL